MILTSRQSVTIPAHLTEPILVQVPDLDARSLGISDATTLRAYGCKSVTIRLDDEQTKLDEWEDPSEFRSDIHVESAATARELAAALLRAADMMEGKASV